MQHTNTRAVWTGKCVLLIAASILSTSACAETDATSKDDGVSAAVQAEMLDLYISNRTRGAVENVTAEQRQQLAGELDDLRLMAKKAEEQGLADKPNVAAQVELQRLSVLTSALAGEYLKNNPVTDADVQAEYELRFSSAQGEQYKARHILVETQDDATAIIAQLDGGADFAELAKEKSTGPSGPNGGDLGWFTPESMVKPFSDAVVALENGAYTSAPVQTQFGWHVILREDSRVPEPPALDEVRDRLKPAAEQRKLQAYLDGLRAAESAN